MTQHAAVIADVLAAHDRDQPSLNAETVFG